MEILLTKSLRRIVVEGRPGPELVAKCEEAIAKLSAGTKSTDSRVSTDADEYFSYFQAACGCGQSKVVELALDAIHSLIQFGFLRGKKSMALTEPASGVSSGSGVTQVDAAPGRRTLMDVIIETVCKCSDEFDDSVQLQTIKVLLTAVTSTTCDVNESSLLLAVRACFHIHLISKNPVNKVTTKAALTQMVCAVFAKMEAIDAASKPSNEKLESNTSGSFASVNEKDETVSGVLHFASVAHKDAFLLFRALCKLSMKGLHDDAHSGAQADAVALQNKILSLELILHLLVRSGQAFRNGERFVHVIRHYLCVSLLGNCTSQVVHVTDLSLQIFVALMEGFKDHLKSELEVFFTSVFLRILDSENSTYEHKLRVLDVFHSICRDPKTLVEIFINYDCDLEAIDLFRRIVDGFARTTKNPNLSSSRISSDFISMVNRKNHFEEQNLRKAGLEGFVTILRSLMRSRGLVDDIAAEGPSLVTSEHNGLDNDINPNIDHQHIGDSPNIVGDEISSAVTTFDLKQRVQEEISNGILKFNLSSKKGLAYMASLGHIQMTGKSVAAFFHHFEERLDKSVVGDFLGREKEYENGFCIEVLHEYVDMIDFAGMEFDLAIRHFLSGFRLPGEAQKIDRIMEKFAERYYLQNQDKFASADMAFILAFSTIMLQTNLHNPAIREDKRMTKEEFIKQNTKISDDGELSVDMLMEIYDRIAAQPISMTQDDKLNKKMKKEELSSFTVFQVSNDKKRYDAFNDERKEIVRAGEAMFRKSSKNTKVFLRRSSYAHQDDAYLSPMFEVIWAPLLGVLSQILETSDEPGMINICLLGFELAIRLSCRIDSATCRSTYINGLIKFTALGTLKEMRYKHIESTKVLISLALSEGDFLDADWVQILQSISHIARLQLLATGRHSDDMFFGNKLTSRSNDSLDSFTKLFIGPSKAETMKIVEEENAHLVGNEVDSVMLDQIFLRSQHLSDESVQHFVRALCTVSFQEITSSMNSLRGKGGDDSTPRIFSLQKLVEVADFNMTSRSRIAWTHIWDLLAQHFTSVGVHENHRLAMYAIDSLKQLSIKFLQKEELANFNFQRVFLRPFEFIMARSRSSEIKDLILRCVDNMILACSTNIRSGWRTIFSILEASAAQDNVEISKLAFQILERLMDKELGLLIFDFVDLMNCLVKFMAGSHTASSLRALDHLTRCAAHLAKVGVTTSFLTHKPHTTSDSTSPVLCEDDGVFRAWWPLLLGLSNRVGEARPAVRQQALETLTNVLRNYGGVFSSQAWVVIFRGVLFPIMDSGKTETSTRRSSRWPSERKRMEQLPDSNDWAGLMGSKVLSLCLEMFLSFKHKYGSSLVLPELMGMIEGCICQDNTECLATIGVVAFWELYQLLGFSSSGEPVQIDHDTMSVISGSISKCLVKSLCHDFGPCGTLTLSSKKKHEIVPIHPSPNAFEQSFEEQPNSESSEEISSPRISFEHTWNRRSAGIMSSMVVTLHLIDLISEICSHSDSLQSDQYQSFLGALQSAYWHARSFNEDDHLRKALGSRSFMEFPEGSTLLPHLLEQEARAATKIVEIAMGLYVPDSRQLALFIEPWIRRYCGVVCSRMMDLDEVARSSSSPTFRAIAGEYKSAVLVLLNGFLHCSLQQFQSGISQSISRLILSSDLEIRKVVSDLLSTHLQLSKQD